MRLAVYTDYSYRRDGDAVYAERAFALFLAGLADHAREVTIAGRLEPEPGAWHYRLPDRLGFVALPHYPSLTHPAAVLRAGAGSVARFWRLLGRVDAVWVLGPHPLGIAFALLALARGRRVALGVRQDLPAYVASRHPDRRDLQRVARGLEAAWRALARLLPTVVVGAALGHAYGRARRLLSISVSLVDEADLVAPERAAERDYAGTLRVLSVGRLDEEKNPLLLADALARLAQDGRDWRLVVCGEGPLRDALAQRLASLGVAHRAELRGYVPIDGGLLDLYRSSHAFLHVSWTEGMPQVLLEAFAAGVPVVATAVGGVAAMAGDAALLVSPGDPEAAATALRRIARDADLRARLVEAGHARAARHTRQAETRRVAEFLLGS